MAAKAAIEIADDRTVLLDLLAGLEPGFMAHLPRPSS